MGILSKYGVGHTEARKNYNSLTQPCTSAQDEFNIATAKGRGKSVRNTTSAVHAAVSPIRNSNSV